MSTSGLNKGVDMIQVGGGGALCAKHVKKFDPIVSKSLKCIKIRYFQVLYLKFVAYFWSSNYMYH